MKIVKENINFERGQDPKSSLDIGLLKALEEKGVVIDISWDKEGREKSRLEANVKILYEAVTLLIESGVNPEEIIISGGDTLYIRVYRIMDGNVVKNECLSKEDAESLLKVIKSFSISNETSWHISENRDDKLLFVRQVLPWLRKIKENREKYKNLL